MSRIIAICPQEYPGVSSVFRNGQAFKLWSFYELHQKFPREAELFILGAWHPAYRKLIPSLKGKKTILITSTPAQLEMGIIDMQFLKFILELKYSKEIDEIFCGSKILADYISARHFPYPIYLENIEPVRWESKVPYSAGLFLPSHYRKNIFNQVIALNMLRKKFPQLDVITNVQFQFKPSFFRSIGWQPRKKYKEILGSLKVVLHVTWTESLGYAAIDALKQGTLPLVSLSTAKILGLEWNVYDSDDPEAILKQLEQILDLEKTRYILEKEKGVRQLKLLSEGNLIALIKILESLTG